MTAALTKPLVVPEYTTATVKMYVPDGVTGAATARQQNTFDVQDVVTALFPGRAAAVNACALTGNDLFIANSSADSQCIFKVADYVTNPENLAARTFVFTLDGTGYVGILTDGADELFAAEGDYQNNHVVMYTGAANGFPGADAAAGDNYATRVDLGNAGATSYFANLALDSARNLWVSDYLNHRLVVFDAANLGQRNTFHVLANVAGPISVANTNATLRADAADHLFAEPEGLAFDASGDLWVANNNDGNGAGALQNTRCSLVRITPNLQNAVLASAPGATFSPNAANSNIDFFIYQVPNLADDAGARPQFGGLQIDRAAARIYVSEEVGGNGRAYDIATIADIGTATAPNDLAIVTTNPGNGGIALVEAILMIVADDFLGSQRNGVNNVGMNLGDFDHTVGPIKEHDPDYENSNYPEYPDSLFNFYRDADMESARVLFTWEALQPTTDQNGPVPGANGDPVPSQVGRYKTYWDSLVDVVTRLLARDIYVTLGMYQYNPASQDTDIVYNGDSFTPEQFADFWGKFATKINTAVGVGNQHRVAFDLINEPHSRGTGKAGDKGTDPSEWFLCAHEAITAIRTAGANNTILVPGMYWAGAADFCKPVADVVSDESSADRWLALRNQLIQNNVVGVDNIAVTAHLYIYGDAQPFKATALRDDCQQLVEWARTNGVKVHIGEVAIDDGHDKSDPATAAAQWADWHAFCTANSDVIIGWNWWANGAGGWWDTADSGDQDGRHWALSTDNGASQTHYMDLIQSSISAMNID